MFCLWVPTLEQCLPTSAARSAQKLPAATACGVHLQAAACERLLRRSLPGTSTTGAAQQGGTSPSDALLAKLRAHAATLAKPAGVVSLARFLKALAAAGSAAAAAAQTTPATALERDRCGERRGSLAVSALHTDSASGRQVSSARAASDCDGGDASASDESDISRAHDGGEPVAAVAPFHPPSISAPGSGSAGAAPEAAPRARLRQNGADGDAASDEALAAALAEALAQPLRRRALLKEAAAYVRHLVRCPCFPFRVCFNFLLGFIYD